MSSRVDAIAALRIWGLAVDLGGMTFQVPPLPASDWIEAVLSEETPLPIVPGLLDDEDQDTVLEMIVDGRATIDDIVDRSREALQAAAGRPWWEADRLIRSAADQWELVGGELTRVGVNLAETSLAAVLNAIYVICVRNLDEKKRNQFDMDLRRPPLGAPAEALYDAQAAESAFLALMGQARPPGA